MNIGDAVGLSYRAPVFRPPAEARSLILQVTIGCSWNKCTFCEMYQDKAFQVKPLAEIEADLKLVAETVQQCCDNNLGSDATPSDFVRDVFLADGDAMTLPQGQLLQILSLIRKYLPHVRRVSSYCLPRNVRYKSTEDLKELHQHGLSLVYVGCESGNDQVLEAVSKGETYQSSVDALVKLKEAGIKRSVMILLGLGGTDLSLQHAMDSAKLCTATEPEFLSVLTTSFPRGMERVEEGYRKHSISTASSFQPQTARESLRELKVFLEHQEIPTSARTVFRSDHASNYFLLKGRLGRDKERLLSDLSAVLGAPEEEDRYNLRPEWARGL
ncbi:radical SAM superfamily protein [Nitzschia inconspicua]|uniref:Radical SAM superfamily protein n=1 Tax=Nitzschia inconspicua TaxID=303405 RepID=A0A9K3LT16_9STRA|nr:radical SAM superfamily protein [Nitzschia inconspicua]